jgi:cobalt-zinc-cadmium efflux system protein
MSMAHTHTHDHPHSHAHDAPVDGRSRKLLFAFALTG